MDPANLEKARTEGFHKLFKLQTTMATTSMVLFDSKGCIRFYDTPEEILQEFYTVRLEGYIKRKDYLIGLLEAEAKRLSNQVNERICYSPLVTYSSPAIQSNLAIYIQSM